MQPANKKWCGARLWFLLNLTPEELREVFPEQQWNNLRKKRKHYRKLIDEHKEKYPDEPEGYYPFASADEIRALIDKPSAAPAANEQIINQDTRQRLHKLLDDTLDKANVNPEAVKSFRINAGSHQGYIKNSDNEIEYTNELPKQNISLLVEPEAFKMRWDPIERAEAVIIDSVQPKAKRKDDKKVCVVLPDPQIGYYRYGNGKLEPFHDTEAISVALQIIEELRPDKVVCLGDYLDLPMFGTYEQSENYAHTSQPAIEYGYKFLAHIRALVPDAEIVVLEGNHDRRMEKNMQKSNLAAWGIKRAEDTEGWPVFSIPFLLRFDELDVKYVEGYPAGKFWINEKLQCIHGHIVGPPGQTAAKVVKAETVSTLFGHIHRIETAYDTQNVYGGARSNVAHSPGCLCRIDGAVPSAKGSTLLSGEPVKSYENWQQGLAVITYEDGDSSFNLEQIYINTLENHKAAYGGKIYEPVTVEGLN